MGIYLLDHPPVRSQWKARTRTPTGLIVVHTAENVTDTVGPDTGAEAVAAFIQRRTTPGCYHDLADADSLIQVAPYDVGCYHDGTGSNPYSLSISFALAAADWMRLSHDKREGFLRNGAHAFAKQQAWLRSKGYPTTPVRRVNKVDSTNGAAGLISHGERDPERRSDPGRDFPWDRFMQLCREATGGGGTPPPPPPPVGNPDNIPTLKLGMNDHPVVASLQRFCNAHNWTPDLPLLTVDGDYGPGTQRVVAGAQRQMGISGPDADGSIVGPKTKRAFWGRGWRG